MEKYRFGEFELDLNAFELRSRGKVVRLERRPFDLLVLLVRDRGRLVPRERIIATLWPPNVVIDFDAGLNTLVRKARSALGDSSDSPKFIETVPGRGYRFIAPVIDVAVGGVATADGPVHNIAEAGARGADISAAPIDPEAVAADSSLDRAPRPRGQRRWLLPAGLAALVAAVLLSWMAPTKQPEVSRIAVLPFENLTGNEELSYLASGLAEDLSAALAQIDVERLRVIGVSTRAPMITETSIADVGRRLGVDLVVASALRLDGSHLRITSRLLRVADNEQIWSQALDRELTNVLGLQRELSVAIAEQVRLRLSPEVATAIERRQTQNPEAYALYLKGRYEWTKLTPAATRRALEYFEEATAADPSYALAWAGLAFGAITSTRTADVAPAAAVPVAANALQRALELGPDLAETQYARGYLALFHDVDATAAEAAARAAIELDPNNAQAYMLLGVTLPVLGKHVEAREMMRRARELDPMYALAFANSANVALQAGDVEGGLELARQTVAVDPDFWLGHYYVGGARRRLGDLDGALRSYEDAARLSDGHSITALARADVLIQLERLDEARALLADMTARAAVRYVPPFAIAVVHARLGDVDAAFEWLDRAVAAKDLNRLSIPTDTRLAPLRDDPRFADLLRRCECAERANSLR